MKKNCRILLISMMVLVLTAVMGISVFAESNADWTPSQNQDKFEGIEYGLGMFSAAAKGTDIVINDDGTVTLNITTKPMVSTRYAKVAFSLEQLTDMEQAAAGISVTVSKADDTYINPFSGENEGTKTYYWSVFSYTMPVEALEQTIYTAGFNTVHKENDTYVEYEGTWAYSSTWKVNPTLELTQKLRDKQAAVSDSSVAARIGQVADHLEALFPEYLMEKARQAVADAKADLTNKEKVEKALAACEKLTDEQKAELADDIKTLKEAKAEIERKEKEAEKKKAIAKVKAAKVTGFKAKAAKRKVTFTWKKNAVFGGYQLQYTVKGSKKKTLTITSYKTVKKIVKKLKKGKKVTSRIRGFKKVSGTKYYGKWVSAKAVKVK